MLFARNVYHHCGLAAAVDTAFVSSFSGTRLSADSLVSPNKKVSSCQCHPLNWAKSCPHFYGKPFPAPHPAAPFHKSPTVPGPVSPVGKILIPGFKPAKVVRVHRFLRLAVRSEKNLVLVIEKEFTRSPRLPSQFRLPRPNSTYMFGYLFSPRRRASRFSGQLATCSAINVVRGVSR